MSPVRVICLVCFDLSLLSFLLSSASISDFHVHWEYYGTLFISSLCVFLLQMTVAPSRVVIGV